MTLRHGQRGGNAQTSTRKEASVPADFLVVDCNGTKQVQILLHASNLERKEKQLKPKHRTYSLWLKWKLYPSKRLRKFSKGGWAIEATVKNLPWPAENPIKFLRSWVETGFVKTYWGPEWKKKFKILPEGKKP